ncbi:hypothetical protein [Campylobacter sputorum]|uniref:hypothetical protein n=1 Tax=Campylobacter sputorum TaxID=206 RepID=UPI000A8DD376|nr:hypothetical protein [Campylobacter sputorum]
MQKDLKTLKAFFDFVKNRTNIFSFDYGDEAREGFPKSAKIFINILDLLKCELEAIKKDKARAETKIANIHCYYNLKNNISEIERTLFEFNVYYQLNATDDIKIALKEISELKIILVDFISKI